MNFDKYNSSQGLKTKVWGPAYWFTFFTMIIGAYPPKIDENNPDHIKIRRAFINFFCNLKYLLPCRFCRDSYKNFYKQLDIKKFSSGRIEMMYWLYLVKDLVNKKLLKQETEYLTDIKQKYSKKTITKEEYAKLKKICFKTKATGSFKEVLEQYNSLRAKCSKKLKKCV